MQLTRARRAVFLEKSLSTYAGKRMCNHQSNRVFRDSGLRRRLLGGDFRGRHLQEARHLLPSARRRRPSLTACSIGTPCAAACSPRALHRTCRAVCFSEFEARGQRPLVYIRPLPTCQNYKFTSDQCCVVLLGVAVLFLSLLQLLFSASQGTASWAPRALV